MALQDAVEKSYTGHCRSESDVARGSRRGSPVAMAPERETVPRRGSATWLVCSVMFEKGVSWRASFTTQCCTVDQSLHALALAAMALSR